MEKQNCLIYCNCGANIISEEKKNALSQAFKALAIDVIELHDLCAFSLNEKEYLQSLEDNYDKKFIIACYPRAIKNIFSQNNIQISNYEVFNFRIMETEAITNELQSKIENTDTGSRYIIEKSKLDVPAWYPVIEEDRCTLCGQCARFCLFGVYKFDKKNLEVVNPLHCKNNCPACGRTCPSSAIIFPRLKDNSVLSGADPSSAEKTVKQEQNEGLFVLLNERNKNRKAIFKPGVKEQAEAERKKALEEIKKGLGRIQ